MALGRGPQPRRQGVDPRRHPRRQLAPRQRLIEADLCERLGASRFQVRTALQDLAAQGLAKDMRTAVESGELMRYSELNVQLHATLRKISGHTITAQLLEHLRSVIEAFTAFANASAS